MQCLEEDTHQKGLPLSLPRLGYFENGRTGKGLFDPLSDFKTPKGVVMKL